MKRSILPLTLFVIVLVLAYPLPAWRYVLVCGCMAAYSCLK